jgi:uncharacterized protein (TIGR00106 family)
MLAELRVTPVGTQRVEFAQVVSATVRAIAERSRLQYVVHAMGTTLEGPLDDILAAVRACHEEVRKHCNRALVELSIDDRSGAEGELVRSLEHVRRIGGALPLERLVRGGGGGADPFAHGAHG